MIPASTSPIAAILAQHAAWVRGEVGGDAALAEKGSI